MLTYAGADILQANTALALAFLDVAAASDTWARGSTGDGAQFACFSGTKVQILTQKALAGTLYYEQGLLEEAEGALKMSLRLGLN